MNLVLTYAHRRSCSILHRDPDPSEANTETAAAAKRLLDSQVPAAVLCCAVLYCTVLRRYRGEDITVHEFAHSLHLLGLTFVFPSFEQELQTLYDEARCVAD